MTLEEKDAYIAEHLMKLEPDTLRFMVADLTAEVERLSNILSVDSKDWTALEESLIASRAERDKYKTALEEIHGLYPDTNPPGVILARGIARNALTK